jgi:hypothetical protein
VFLLVLVFDDLVALVPGLQGPAGEDHDEDYDAHGEEEVDLDLTEDEAGTHE